MPDALRVLIATDGERTADGAIVPHVYATQIEFLRHAGTEVHLFGVDDRTSVPGILRNARELRQAINKFKPDLLVTYYGTMVAAISRIAANTTPLLITFRGSDLLGTSNPGWKWQLRDRLGRMLSLWAATGAKGIIVNGEGLFLSLPMQLRRKAYNLPNGIDTAVFSPLSQQEARQRMGWQIDEKVILFNAGVGNGQVVKNLPLAKKVLHLVRQHIPARLETISNLMREEVALRMNASDCLLITSLHEGSPDLVKEAMACDLPVVSVACGDVRERLQGVTLSSVHPYEATALAKAVSDVLLAGRRSNGREQLFAQGLDIASVTQHVLAVYSRAALRGSTSDRSIDHAELKNSAL
jgi:teichuronic acid biosynthesis glycosyltransferase TuaC